MALLDHHRRQILDRGFDAKHIDALIQYTVLESLTAEQIQADWLNAFPKMEGNKAGALLLRFNDGTTSLKPDKPDWNEEKQRFDKYLYAKRPQGEPKGFNTQPWIPSKPPSIATEGLFDALVSTILIDTPCAAATAPSHIRYSEFPESVKVYCSDADVPFHHFTGLLPVVIGQCRRKKLKLTHLPRNPDADYAYTDDRIPEDCKWGMEEWCKEWKRQGLDPKAELKKVIADAKEPLEYLRSIFLDYGKAGIQYPLNNAQLVTGARAISDASDRHDQRLMLRDLLHQLTKAPKKWIDNQIQRRDQARADEEYEQAQERIELGLEDPPEPIELEPADPYEIADGRPVDVHLSNLLLNGDTIYGSYQSSLFTYDDLSGFWLRKPQHEALNLIQGHIEQVFTLDRYGERTYGYGTNAQTNSCLSTLITKAYNSKLANPAPCIPFTDQTYNCRTEQAVPHSPDHGATYGVDAPLLLTESCPEAFSKAIDTCYGEEVLPVLRAWIRAIVDPTIPYGKFLLIIGNTGTGKGMLLEFLDSLLPSSCRSSLEEPGDIANADKVYQFVLGKRYISFEDLPARLKPMQLFYKLVENAEVSARKLNASDSANVAANCRFSAGATKFPTLADGNDGFVRRALVLTTKPRLQDPDRKIKDAIVGSSANHLQLRAEVIGWALSMPRQDVIDTLYGDAAADVLNANLDDLEANADAVAHFIDECLEPSKAEVTPVMWSWIYDCFRTYCDKQGFNGKGSKFHLQGRIRGKLPHLYRKRGKESLKHAKANGRDRKSRINLPSCDWGFTLRQNLFYPRPDGSPKLIPAHLGIDGLATLRDHNPPCPQDSGLNVGDTLRQNTDTGGEKPVTDKLDAVSQGSSLIDESRKKDIERDAHNAVSPSPFSIELPDPPHNPRHPETPPQLPDWADLDF